MEILSNINTIIGLIIGIPTIFGIIFYKPIKRKIADYKDRRKKTLKIFLERVHKEIPNFKHIKDKKPYSSSSHQKAVEIYSFELLQSDLDILPKTFSRWKKKILENNKMENVDELLSILNTFSEKYKKYIT